MENNPSAIYVEILQRNYRIPRPRIVKSDFRRHYATMWVNVFNSCDQGLLARHIETFYDRNVSVVQFDLRQGNNTL